jgi:hypothetical protein
MVRACLPKPWRRQGRPPWIGHRLKDLFINVPFRHAGLEAPAPYLIRGHPEPLEKTGFRLEFTPLQNGAGMTTFGIPLVCRRTLIKRADKNRNTIRLSFLFLKG